MSVFAEGTNGKEGQPSGIEISPEAARSREAVIDKLEEKRDEMVSQVEDAFNEKISFGGDQMEERAKHYINLLRDKQIEEIKKTYDELIADFNKRVEQDSNINLEQLANELLSGIKTKTNERLEKLKIVISKNVAGDFMTTKESAVINRAIEGIIDFEKTHPELHQLFVKISEGGNISADEYGQIISLINPAELPQLGNASQEAYETSAAGLLISTMSAEQRFELVKYYMDSEKKDLTSQLIDGFLRTDVLTLLQGEELFKVAISRGVITQEEYDSTYKEKIEGTFYTDEIKKFKDVLQSDVYQKYSGRFSKNIVERFVGKPLIYSLVMLWGGTTALVNMLASREPGNFAQTLKNIASSKLVGVGLGATLVGIEGASGSIKEGRGRGGVLEFLGLGEGYITKLIENLLSDEEKEDVVKRNSLKVLAENYLGAPNDLRTYLESGGHNNILKFRTKKDKDGNSLLSLDSLIESEDNPAQKERLKNLQAQNAKPESKIDKMIFGVAISAEALGIDEKERKLSDWLKTMRESQISAS